MGLLQEIDIRTCGKVLKELKNQRCYGIQSIEMYCCDMQSSRRLIVGIRCGEVLEAQVTDRPDKAMQQTI